MRKPLKHLVLLDKPAGITSHDAVQLVRKIYCAKKAGHCGTLDSGVTGLLVIALDEATKAMPVLMGLDKEYEGEMRMHAYRPENEIKAAFKKFTGTITQVPPVRSRVKRVPRKRTIHSLKLLSTDSRNVKFRVLCEAGTYIRKLVHDIGEYMGCGAHMSMLRRIAVGPFHYCVAAERIRKTPEKYLVPLELALKKTGLKKAVVSEEGLRKIQNGGPVGGNELLRLEQTEPGEYIGIYYTDNIVAIGKRTEAGVRPDRVFR